MQVNRRIGSLTSPSECETVVIARSRSRNAVFSQLNRLSFREPSSRSYRAGSVAAPQVVSCIVITSRRPARTERAPLRRDVVVTDGVDYRVVPLVQSGLRCGLTWGGAVKVPRAQ